MRILILDGDCNAACTIVQSLGQAGYECWLAAPTTVHHAFSSKYVAMATNYPDPLSDREAFLKWIIAYQEQHQFALIIPPSECTLIPLHDVRNHPALDGIIALPNVLGVEIAFDKEKLRHLASSLNIPTPTNLLASKIEDLEHPLIDEWSRQSAVVLKGIRSKIWGDHGVHENQVRICRTKDEILTLGAQMLKHTQIQIQQWVPGVGVGIELLADKGEIVLSFAHERVHELPLTGGGSSYRKSIKQPPALLADAEKLMRALEWSGVAMVEYRYHEPTKQYWLMEINGRFWGSLPLPMFAGVDFPKALVELMLAGKTPETKPYRLDVYARNVSRDFQWIKAIVRRDRDNPLLLTKPLPESLLQWGRLFIGKEVWDGARANDPGPITIELKRLATQEWRVVKTKVARLSLLAQAKLQSKRQQARLGQTRNVLVLCYGNICRSAYVHARLAQKHGFDAGTQGGGTKGLAVRSAGFHHKTGRTSPDLFQHLAAERGVHLADHRSAQVTREDMEWADTVVLMDERNQRLFNNFSPKHADKVLWLGALDPSGAIEVADPYDFPPNRMRDTMVRLDTCTDTLVSGILSGNKNASR